MRPSGRLPSLLLCGAPGVAGDGGEAGPIRADKLVESPPKELLRQPTDSHAWAKSVAPPAPSYKALLLPSVLLPHKHARPMEHDLKIDSKELDWPGRPTAPAGLVGAQTRRSTTATARARVAAANERAARLPLLRAAGGRLDGLSEHRPAANALRRAHNRCGGGPPRARGRGGPLLFSEAHSQRAPRQLTVAAATEGANKEAADARRLNHVGGLKGLRSLGGGSERSASETSSTSAPSTPSVPRRKSLLASAASLVSPRRGSTNGNELM